MVVQDWWGKGDGLETGDMRGRVDLSSGSFKERNVGAINGEGTGGIGGGNRAVVNLVVTENALERLFGRATNHTVKGTSGVGSLHLSWGE